MRCDDRPGPDRHQELRRGSGCRRACCANSAAQPARSRRAPSWKGSNHSPGAAAHEEVPGHADAVQLQPAAATDLEHHDAERDRDAEVAVEHVVEERVARVAVVGLVAAEALGHEQQRRQLTGRAARGARRERVELREPRVDVEIGVRVRGDEQRGLVERDLGLRARHELGEALGRRPRFDGSARSVGS